MSRHGELRENLEYEEDLEQRRYHRWVVRFPQRALEILADFIALGPPLQREDLLYFQAHGVDLNALGNFPNDLGRPVTLLNSLAEYRRTAEVKLLLEEKVDPNLVSGGFSPLESAILGHNLGYLEETESAIELVNLLRSYGSQPIASSPESKEILRSLTEGKYQDSPKLLQVIAEILRSNPLVASDKDLDD